LGPEPVPERRTSYAGPSSSALKFPPASFNVPRHGESNDPGTLAGAEPALSARRAAANFLAHVVGDAAAKRLGLVAYATLGRRLGASSDGAYGALEAALATVFIASLCVEGGLAPYGARAVAADPSSARKLAARIGLLRLVWAALAALALGGYVVYARPPAAVATLIGWYALTLFPYALYAEWLFQGRNEPWWVAPPQILRNLFLWCAAFLCVRGPADAWMAPVADGLGFLAGALLQQAAARRRVGAPDFAAPRALFALARASFPTLLSGLFFVFRVFYPMTLAGRIAAPEVADGYAGAHRLFVSLHAVVPLFCINLLPSWARAWTSGDMAAFRRSVGGGLAALGAGAAAAAVVAATDLPAATLAFVYRDPAFSAAGGAFSVLLLALGALAVSAVPRFAFIAIGRPRFDAASNAVGALCVAAWAATLGPEDAPTAVDFARIVLGGELVAGLTAWGCAAALASARRRAV
jgi:O-antigen/teichoic acid export membrane protein